MRRVVVTGIGIVSPLGVGVDHVWKKLIKGESGISSIQSFDVSDLPAKIAGQVPRGETSSGRFNADDYVSPKDQKKMDDFIVMAMAAADEAVKDAGWQREHMTQNRLAIIPNHTHYDMFLAPELVPTVLPFLNGYPRAKSWGEQVGQAN